MDKVFQLLQSRTVWTLLVMIALNMVQLYGNLLTPEQLGLINAILGALAAYFRVNPKANF